MVYDYLITFKRRNHRSTDLISQLLYFFALLAFGYFAYLDDFARSVYLVINLLILITWVFCHLKKQKTGMVFYRLGLFIAAIGWLIKPYGSFWLAVLYVVAGFLEKQVKFPEEIGFSESSVVLNTFPRKTFSWDEISNVVLKDNMLTVDFRNNKLIQKEIDAGVSLQTEAEFNEFCRRQLSAAMLNADKAQVS